MVPKSLTASEVLAAMGAGNVVPCRIEHEARNFMKMCLRYSHEGMQEAISAKRVT